MGQLDIGCRWAGAAGHSKQETLLGQLVVEPAVGGVEIDRRAGLPADGGDAEDVIEMRMSEPDRGDPAVTLRGCVEEQPGLLAGVDQNGCGVLRIVDEVAVLREPTVRNDDDLERWCRQAAASARVFRSVRYFSTAMAAVVASPTAVVTCRVSWARRSPAAKSPGIEVIIRSSVSR